MKALLPILLAALPSFADMNTTYPDHRLTPGVMDQSVTQATVMTTICKPNYTASVRDVTQAEKKDVLALYRNSHSDWPTCASVKGVATCEIDHLISLEIGGSNAEKNLWPEPYGNSKTKPQDRLGAREKDVVETYLHREICAGKITLAQARDQILTDWVQVYRSIPRKSH